VKRPPVGSVCRSFSGCGLAPGAVSVASIVASGTGANDASRASTSIEIASPGSGASGTPIATGSGDAEDSPDLRAEHHEMTVLVRDWLTRLPDKQRIVIMRRFGLDNDDPATLETLAEEMGVTRERVRQIQQEALVKLKRAMAARGVVRDSLL